MPLKNGNDEATIGENIAELRRAGHQPKQAAAIAYQHAGVGEHLHDRHTGHHKKKHKKAKPMQESAHGDLGPDG